MNSVRHNRFRTEKPVKFSNDFDIRNNRCKSNTNERQRDKPSVDENNKGRVAGYVSCRGCGVVGHFLSSCSLRRIEIHACYISANSQIIWQRISLEDNATSNTPIIVSTCRF